MFKIKSLCAIIALSAAPFVAADELSETGEFIDGVAAIVNEGVVLKSQLRDETAMIIKRARDQGFQLPPPDVLQEQLLERLIVTEIQLQRADQIGLVISDQMLNDSIQRMAQTAGIRFEDMPAALAEDGIEYADFRRGLRDEITLEQLRRIMVAQNINVSDREIQACMTDIEDNAVVNSTWNLSHILLNLPEGATASQIDEIEMLAQSISEQVRDGADFGRDGCTVFAKRYIVARRCAGLDRRPADSVVLCGDTHGYASRRRVGAVPYQQQLSYRKGRRSAQRKST